MFGDALKDTVKTTLTCNRLLEREAVPDQTQLRPRDNSWALLSLCKNFSGTQELAALPAQH